MDDFLVLTDLRGGRSGRHQCSLGENDNQVDEAMNIDYFYSRCGNKRWGCQSISLSGQGTQVELDCSMFRHVPGGDETVAELWTFNQNSTNPGSSTQVQRLTLAGWLAPTVVDAIQRANRAEVRCATLNGKMFTAYKSDASINRLHVWDGSTLRRVGIATGVLLPVAALGAGGGVGAIVSDTRTYKIAWTKQVAGITTYRSELTGFSNGIVYANQRGTITRPTVPGEGETHWELYGYSDDDSYATGYLIATTVIATTTAADNLAVLSGDAPPEPGLNEVPTSWKYLMVHGNRLLGAGSHETGGKNNRVWFTSPLGASDIGDDERISNTLVAKNRVDIDENDGGAITGFGGVVNGSVIVFKYRRTFRLIPTGQLTAPYQQSPTPISNSVGCIRQETVVQAEDENGEPCVYWLSAQGPYRYGVNGLQYIGRDIEDVWLDAARGTNAPAHGLYHADKKQVWWWIGSSDAAATRIPDRKIVFHTQLGVSTSGGVRKGWVLGSGRSASALASCMFSYAFVLVADGGTPGMGIVLGPYTSYGVSRKIYRCDVVGVVLDDAVAAPAYIRTHGYSLAGIGNIGDAIQPVLLVGTESGYGGTLNVAAEIIRDYGIETVSDVVNYVGQASEQYRFAILPVSAVGGRAIQINFGDVATLAAGGDFWWSIEGLAIQRSVENRIG